MSYRRRPQDDANASPIPIRGRRRSSMSGCDDGSGSPSYYRPAGSRPGLNSHRRDALHHHEHTHRTDGDREVKLPRQIRQSLAPEERDSSSEETREHGCDRLCHERHQWTHHESYGRKRHGSYSPPIPYHCHDCTSERSQHGSPRRHASLHLPARQVTFQGLPPTQESYLETGMGSMNDPPPGGNSTFAGPFPSQLRQAGHAPIMPTVDYTTMSHVSGMNVQTMPFASPHIGSGMGAGYPNAMPLSRSMEILPAPGQYGAPKYAKFVKPG